MSSSFLKKLDPRVRRDAARIRSHFDSEYYLSENPDIAAAETDPLWHYVRVGWKEGRDPSADFATFAYRYFFAVEPDRCPLIDHAENPSREIEGKSFGDLVRTARKEVDVSAPFVDDKFYREQADFPPRVSPALHFALIGWREGFDPNPDFSTERYLGNHTDVAEAKVNPLWHYVVTGWKEERRMEAPDGTVGKKTVFDVLDRGETTAIRRLRSRFGLGPAERPTDEELEAFREGTHDVLPYGILFTARSGSTFLTHELSRRQRYSTPHEWFNWNAGEANDDPKTDILSFMRQLIDAQRAYTGAFGFEINWIQLAAMRDVTEIQNYFAHRIIWFVLRRRDIVAQAVSLVIANQTKLFHSYQLKNSDTETRPEPVFDADAIERTIREFVRQEKKLDEWCREQFVAPIPLYYEDITADPARSVAIFANALRIWDARESTETNPIRKIGSGVNLEFAERFRSQKADLMASLEAERPGDWLGGDA